jgi:hypothetical protein
MSAAVLITVTVEVDDGPAMPLFDDDMFPPTTPRFRNSLMMLYEGLVVRTWPIPEVVPLNRSKNVLVFALFVALSEKLFRNFPFGPIEPPGIVTDSSVISVLGAA